MNLSPLMLVTSRHQMKPSFEHCLEVALLSGASLIQLREKDLDQTLFTFLAEICRKLCSHYNAELLINGRPKMAQRLGIDGLHLPESSLELDALPKFPVMGFSVHSLENAKRAEAMGANYLIYGSVFSTASHPEIVPVGLDELHKVTQAVSCPVYAIGGISAANAKSCKEAGAYGVSVISAVWQAPDVAQATRDLLEVLL
ncbi:MAG: thiamine phosphate synthase [Abditibacteriaceae bacterium]